MIVTTPTTGTWGAQCREKRAAVLAENGRATAVSAITRCWAHSVPVRGTVNPAPEMSVRSRLSGPDTKTPQRPVRSSG